MGRSLSRVVDVFAAWGRRLGHCLDEFRRGVASVVGDAPDGAASSPSPYSAAACDAVFDEYDADGSGAIEYREYVTYAVRDRLRSSWSRVVDLFHKWDADGTGVISKAELRRAVKEMGFDLDDADRKEGEPCSVLNPFE